VRACDSIGANLVEGDGRCHHKETLNFFYIARGSAKETRYWLKRARARRLISQEDADRLDLQIERIRRWINAMIGERRRWLGQVKEDRVEYLADELT
jgi:four helix bundle protein